MKRKKRNLKREDRYSKKENPLYQEKSENSAVSVLIALGIAAVAVVLIYQILLQHMGTAPYGMFPASGF